MQEALEGNGFGKVNIVRLENTNKGALWLVGYNEQNVGHRLLPAKDKNLAVMAWPGKGETDQSQIQEGITNLLVLKGTQSNDGDLFVGPAVNYSSPETRIDERGAALWTKVD